jgi:hypothetical protein
MTYDDNYALIFTQTSRRSHDWRVSSNTSGKSGLTGFIGSSLKDVKKYEAKYQDGMFYENFSRSLFNDHPGSARMTCGLCPHHGGKAAMMSELCSDHPGGARMTCGLRPHHGKAVTCGQRIAYGKFLLLS